MAWTGYLDAAELAAVERAVIDADLAMPDKLSALMLSLPRRYVGLLDGFTLPPVLRLRSQLTQMNRVHNLKTGEVPLALFLTAAIEASADAAVLKVLEEALAKVKRYEPPATAAAVPGAEAVGQPAPSLLAGANLQVTQEVQIGDADETLPVDYLSRGVEAARSVFKIVVHRHFDGQGEFIAGDLPRLSNGTGWVIAPSLGNQCALGPVRRGGRDCRGLPPAGREGEGAIRLLP
jgi:hypothetical protein